ncbi:TadE/TadG family type IV pilus assembly protein [Chelativorans salis]|uniref:Pilus assembly protein n=1 Tax=Chelativorans salis TaxID=2978478 RepID=A0ABT2LJL0_9HYPH|nr:TadE/TadG family type IV pilus assembly protein [Chelativorans sp. EGI FJ00035]MCT7373873.1 pilus assembly protein [Chelativorans sp. EGI FJ00035]
MLRKFRRDERGNYAMLTALVMVPVMGALALAIDYTQMSRHRQATLNALDAANMATAWRLLEGKSKEELIVYANDFFTANLGPVKRENTKLHITFPDSSTGGNTLKMQADLTYKPIFYPVFQALRGEKSGDNAFALNASNEVRLRNTVEVALVLDNSGSMDFTGSGSGKKRIDLLKAAAKELVDTLANQGAMMQQVAKPVQFGIVPFAASVNVGSDKEGESWLDMDGVSSIHHENFDWDTMATIGAGQKRVEKVEGIYRKLGKLWALKGEENEKVTRFTLFNELEKVTGSAPWAYWAGCVEMRPGSYGLDNTVPNRNNPDTLFVPMFAPDETDIPGWRGAYNNWWADQTGGEARERLVYMPKYFPAAMQNPSVDDNKGPNLSCTTKPITPLTDVTTSDGLETIKNAIDGMVANGATNVPEGMAWGWRVVSSKVPFTEGRPDEQKGNDKVVIVLTDGANTYYTPQSLGARDDAENRSIYSNYGYARNRRIFENTTVDPSIYTNDNYTKAMNQQFAKLCDNAKGTGEGKEGEIIVMTVALDLSKWKADEKAQIEALEACASESRFRKDENGNPAKLFWNATGADLSDKFKEIADELSNLRFVS